MILLSLSVEKKKRLFAVVSGALMGLAGLMIYFLLSNSELDILPMLIKTKDYKKPLRVPGVFSEEYGPNASKGELVFHENGTFSFKYVKSDKQIHAFAGVWFPLENLGIDFSDYDKVEVGIETNRARRIPFNLSVQNNLATHQYIRSLIEVEKGRTQYTYDLSSFFTPTSWYDRNEVAQIDIPPPDFSKIEALSFESCHLLKPGIEDEFTVTRLVLKKDLTLVLMLIAGVVVMVAGGLWILLFGLIRKVEAVIHIPVTHVEYSVPENVGDNVLIFMANNYTNPNLTLSDLSKEFGKNGQDISLIIKEKTKLSFPKYLNFLRIEEAKRILKTGNYKSISDIGYAVGFNSPSNFNRVFKSTEGVSPKTFSQMT